MASLQSQAHAIKDAVSSLSTCTTTTVVTLRNLLQLESSDGASTTTKGAARPPRILSKSRSRAATVTASEEGLSSRDRTKLATHIINVAIKSLTEATKTPVPTSPSKKEQSQKSPTRTTLRRSLSTPLSPLQARTLNRVATSPTVATKASKTAAGTNSTLATQYQPTVECVRLAFACLRSLKGPVTPDQTDFQIDVGATTLVSKLIGLGLHDPAIKELASLKCRLEKGNGTKAESFQPSDLLNFGDLVSQHSLSVVISCQTQALKLIAASRRPKDVEGALSHMKDSCPSSPINTLPKLAGSDKAAAAKSARQLAAFSQILLSMAPSVSSNEDTVAMEPRLSVTPAVAFEIQSLAFRMQLKWWELAGHQGKIDDELLSPYSRCVRCFLRRYGTMDAAGYALLSGSFKGISTMYLAQNYQPKETSDSPIASIYTSLGSAAHTTHRYSDAHSWYLRMRIILKADGVASVRFCSNSARILAASVKTSSSKDEDPSLLEEVSSTLGGPLSGSSQDVNDLLESALLARRSVAGVLGSRDGAAVLSQKSRHLMQNFLLTFPRFLMRWLGTPPGKEASAKHILQFDQRRQVVTQCINQVLDGAMVVVKTQIADSPDFAAVDEVLRDCAALIENVSDPTLSTSKAGQLSGYYIKISSLYFSLFSQLRKLKGASKADKKNMLHALSRSIDAVKDAPRADKETAQLAGKLEMMASVCKSMGRAEDAAKALRTICTNMVEDGILAQVADALSHQPPRRAWIASDKSMALSRTLRSMAKLDNSLNDWTFFLPETERAAVLEHLLQVTTEDGEAKALQLHDTRVSTLLRIFTADRYPIRRFRVLLMLLFHNIGEEEVSREITTLLEQTLRYAQQKNVAEDSGLMPYIAHLRNQHNSLLAMRSDPFAASTLQECVFSWSTMVQSCSSEEDIAATIDDPDDFLTHLRALDQLAGLKGESRLQLSIQELCVKITQIRAKPTDDNAIVYQCQLASQYVETGLLVQASRVLEEVEQLLGKKKKLSPTAMVNFHLAQAGYLAGMDQIGEAMTCLLKASEIHSTSTKTWSSSQSQATLIRSNASLALSNVALRKGDIQEALGCIRLSVKWLCAEWNALNGPSMDAPTKGAPSLAESVLGKPITEVKPATLGSRLWIWAGPLVKSLIQISSVYAHIGMYPETCYFAKTALNVAEGTASPLYLSMANTWLGSVYVRSGKMEDARPHLEAASKHLPAEVCAARVQLASRLGELWQSVGEMEKSEEHFALAEQTSRLLDGLCHPTETAEEAKEPAKATAAPARAKASTARVAAARTTRTTRARPAATTAKTTVQKRTTAAKAKALATKATASIPRDSYQASLLASVIVSRAMGYMHQHDWSSVASILETVKDLPKLALAQCQEKLILATKQITSSMSDMAHDPVYSVIQDSTISFPAVCNGADKSSARRASVSQSPARKGRTGQSPKERGLPAFMGGLKQAQEALLEAQACAMIAGDNGMLHRISTLLQSTALALAATAPSKEKATIRGDLTTVAVDLARNATWRREIQTLELPSLGSNSVQLASADPLVEKMAGLSLASDMSAFQNDFIELVPEKWSVISLSLSGHGHDLCITKFQAGHGPFTLRLPLERANSRDADSDVFNFEHGREELLDIIKLANETSHSAKSLSSQAGKSGWWDQRHELDGRLKTLLETIESTWFGGFKGIFSQHQRRPDLLARFQTSFHNILDRNLPSRSRAPRGKAAAKAPPINLDPRVLDLFIGLGGAAEPDLDLDEAMNDLLYFVVDILQFHGERNAYDEIDFDAMVVETYDALKAYHQAASKPGNQREDGAHTILVLDKSLHAFPWESMPCLQGLPVSRVPSLACLRRLLLEAKPASMDVDGKPKGHYVSTNSGTCILNPSSDLKNTQTYFEPAVTSLGSWTSHIDRKPEEEAIEKALRKSDLFLYFGHGGGAQYIRAKTIRRLERCRPATFLMGCSSAALTEAGEFECYGQIWHYMMAGCPAVVGTLWDVTDRDIDRFAGRAFENWGLFPRETFKEQELKKKKTAATGEDEGRLEGGATGSVVEAVAAARNVCRFKYLNAAAVVVYGIPVYLE
jgi:separase